MSIKNIILIGMMGSGKSTIAKLLANRLCYKFLDTDELIEYAQGCSISQIIDTQGEDYFRDLERDILADLAQKIENPSVLATGGGIVLRADNRKQLSQLGFVIWLKASPSVIAERLQVDQTRPLLRSDNKLECITEILNQRKSFYEQSSHLAIDTDSLSTEKLCSLIHAQIA